MKKTFVAILLCIFTFVSAGFTSHAISNTKSNTATEKKALIVGGTSGIGLSLATELKKQGYNLIIAGRHKPDDTLLKLDSNDKFIPLSCDNTDLSFMDDITDIKFLALVTDYEEVLRLGSNLDENKILSSFNFNTTTAIQTIKKYYNKIAGDNLHTAIFTEEVTNEDSSIFTLCSTVKTTLSRFIESINIELEAGGCANKIIHSSIDTTCTKQKSSTVENILTQIKKQDSSTNSLDIKLYEKLTLEHQKSSVAFGDQNYKNRIVNNRRQIPKGAKVGYLGGTFDLFHIGHLNILRNAKKYCDYLIVGVHKDASHKGKQTFIPLSERMDIVKNIKYVDECILGTKEDCDAFDTINYQYLFIGSDYKGSEKYNRYEKYFADKGVKIIYFPYTTSTSSTQLRSVIGQAAEKSAAKNAS